MELSLLTTPKNQKEFDSEVRYAISRMEFFTVYTSCPTLVASYAIDLAILKNNYPEFYI